MAVETVTKEHRVTCLRTWLSHAPSLLSTSHTTLPKSYMPKLPPFAYLVDLIKSGYFSVLIGVSVAQWQNHYFFNLGTASPY